ncbi:zinc metalloprotease [Motilibacter aurantiacus]|uniref:peptidase n=1 Tax=Motilibacter aurantiacus TaxID=2714955 RepID=UPI00140AD895|nr:peptidase [Motilibacter aurantiacus]NHC47131.1 peptidase [Motilibacter aurantiacus]
MAGSTGPPPWRQATLAAPRRRKHAGQVVAVGILAACLGIPAVLPRVLPPTATSGSLDATEVPPPGVGEAQGRLLPRVPSGPGTGGYAFTQTQPGTQNAVTYDPCRPLRYAINSEQAPPGAVALVRRAVARVREATGLAFEYVGPTDEPAGPDREAYQPVRYGKQWAPVLIAWSNPEQTPGLAGRVAGLGGSTAWSDGRGQMAYVSGTVTLDTPALAAGFDTPTGRQHVEALVMHELGHVVGLAHVHDPTQLMHDDNIGRTDFGEGDRRGLARAGHGRCQPDL